MIFITNSVFARRPRLAPLAVLLLAGLIPLAAGLSGCGKGPTLPKSEQSESSKRDDDREPDGARPPATAQVPRDAEESSGAASGGSAGPDDNAAADAEMKRAETARRAELEAEARSSAARESAQMAKKAAPPPPPVAASEAPGASAPSATRGLGTVAKPEPEPQPPVAATGPTSKGYDMVPVFFGTDRAVLADPKRLQFGAERGHKLQLGRALITVPDAHKVPNIERPWAIEIPYFKVKVYEETEDPQKHFTIQELSALTKEQMLAFVKERLGKSVRFKDHAFVFVHGFNTSFDASLYRTAQIAYDMKFDGAPFVYSWPSGGKVASYTYDRGSVEQSEPHLAEFLNLVVKESGAKSISLIAHSMGNELLLRVLEQMRSATPQGVVISQVILAAPDVDRDKFTIIAREIASFAKGVTLYAASNDKALGYSARFWGGVPRAGDVPSTGPLVIDGVDTIDVTAVSTDSLGLNHSGYAENTTLLNDIGLLVQTGERPPDKRIPILLKIPTAGGPFWRYPPLH